MTKQSWQIVVASSVEHKLETIPEKFATAIVEFILGPLVGNPHIVGRPLQRELLGLWSVRRIYRVIYEIDKKNLTIKVVRIDHRCDVYRR